MLKEALAKPSDHHRTIPTVECRRLSA